MRLYDSKQETDLRCLDKTSLMFVIIENNMTICIRLLFNYSINIYMHQVSKNRLSIFHLKMFIIKKISNI